MKRLSAAEIASPTTDSFFHCSAVIPANATSTTMVTTGSSFKAAGNTITITSTVNDVNGSTANLPAPATAQTPVKNANTLSLARRIMRSGYLSIRKIANPNIWRKLRNVICAGSPNLF